MTVHETKRRDRDAEGVVEEMEFGVVSFSQPTMRSGSIRAGSPSGVWGDAFSENDCSVF